jgi:hypothetical protein
MFPNNPIAMLIPEVVRRRWYHHFVCHKRKSIPKGLLRLKASNQGIMVINVPWYLES